MTEIKLHNLKSKRIKKSKRLGRGLGSGKGKTGGKGTKGQNARSKVKTYFEGGQIALLKRIPKLKGFNRQKTENQIVKIFEINRLFKDGETVSIETLFEKGLIKDEKRLVKVLGGAELKRKLKFENVNTSKAVDTNKSKIKD